MLFRYPPWFRAKKIGRGGVFKPNRTVIHRERSNSSPIIKQSHKHANIYQSRVYNFLANQFKVLISKEKKLIFSIFEKTLKNTI